MTTSRKRYDSVSDIFDSDDLGIFDDVKPKKSQNSEGDLRKSNFDEINQFLDNKQRKPKLDSSDVSEVLLAKRLESYRFNLELLKSVADFDRYGLLDGFIDRNRADVPPTTDKSPRNDSVKPETPDDDADSDVIDNTDDIVEAGKKSGDGFQSPLFSDEADDFELTSEKSDLTPSQEKAVEEPAKEQYTSIDDILGDDDGLGIFDDIKPELFQSSDYFDVNTRVVGEDDLIANREPCEDFFKFKPTFNLIEKHIQEDSYIRHNVIKEKSIHIGSVFVVNGMLAYVADKYLAPDRENKDRHSERLKLIFANGTESNMLAFSLTLAPYKYENSYQVEITDPEWIDAHFNKSFFNDTETVVSEIEEPDGYIYIAKLKDKPSELYHYRNLHKIGLSKHGGKNRTKSSVNDATFLHREVEIVSEWAIKNANIYKVEGLLHRFFSEAKVSMKVATDGERLHGANEWFNVPLSEIEKAVQLVVSGYIVDYKYDANLEKLVAK